MRQERLRAQDAEAGISEEGLSSTHPCPSPACGRGRDPARSAGRVRVRDVLPRFSTLTLPFLRNGPLPLPQGGRGAMAAAFAFLFAASAAAAEIPAPTQEILRALDLPAVVLDGLDAELAVPPGWIEAAKKE